MNPKFIEAREHIAKAREALRRGDKPFAWKLGEQAAFLAPNMEDAWLILAASDPDPHEALAYAQKALELNPSSARARKGVEWAKDQIKQTRVVHEEAVSFVRIAPIPRTEVLGPQTEAKSGNRNLIYAASFLGLLMCVVLAFAAYSAVTHPAFASILSGAPIPTQADHWARMEIPKPLLTPIDASAFAPAASATPAAPIRATDNSKKASRPTPTEISTEIPRATETPGVMAMEVVEDTPTSESFAPAPS